MAQQITTEILNAALENLTTKRQQIDEQIAEVHRMLGGRNNGAVSPAEADAPKRKMSAAGRKAIAEAQRRRWAAQKAESGPGVAAKAAKPKRKLSAEGRRNIIAALKKRWATKRAAAPKATATKSPTKAVKGKAATAASNVTQG